MKDISTFPQANWWRVQALTFRPREIHLGAPFKGRSEALTVLDEEWLDDCESARKWIFVGYRFLRQKAWFFGTDWRTQYVFEFILLRLLT